MPEKKKLGMLGRALRGLDRTNRATGAVPIQAEKRRKKTKAPVNKNKRGVKPTTSKAKAAAQKAAIRKRVAAKVAAAKKKKKTK